MKVPSAGLENSIVDEVDDVESDTEEEEEEDWSMYEGAIIRIIEPESGDFVPWNEENDFIAVIQTPDGEELPFEEVDWVSDIDEAWTPSGSEIVDDSIDIGQHNITAEVTLPDGSRLAHTIGAYSFSMRMRAHTWETWS